jgi:hypothetical protein
VEPLKQVLALIREKLEKLDNAEKLLYLSLAMGALALWRTAPRARSRRKMLR